MGRPDILGPLVHPRNLGALMDWWWSWLLTFTGVTTFFLAGKKIWWAWYVGLFVNQPIWLIYGILSHQWGFIASTLFYTAVYSKNAYGWTKDHREAKEEEQFSKGMREKYGYNMPPLSVGFKLDAGEFNKNVVITQAALVDLESKLYGPKKWRWLPLWVRKRIFKTPVRLGQGGPVIGKVEHMEMRDNGLFVTSSIDRSTPEGQDAWEKLRGPIDNYSVDETASKKMGVDVFRKNKERDDVGGAD